MCEKKNVKHKTNKQIKSNTLQQQNNDQIIPVPADGKCLYYCFIAARNIKAWKKDRKANGYLYRSPGYQKRAKKDLEEAILIRDEICSLLKKDDKLQSAQRLRGSNAENYPGEDELPYFAQLVNGRIQIILLNNDPDPIVQEYGHGPLQLRIGFELTI